MIVKIIKNLEKRMQKMQESINKDLEDIKSMADSFQCMTKPTTIL